MKIFISADIEGVTTTTAWDETIAANGLYPPHAEQMTREVVAAIEGAKAAGAVEIVVRDAHDSAANIDPGKMPSGVTLVRGWRGSPYSMIEGLDNSFDAVMFVGYHSASGRMGNPLSHTLSTKVAYVKINDVIASEFTLFSYAAALAGVPTVFLSGDKMLCDDVRAMHPCLVTCAVKDGVGAMTINYSPVDTLKSIRELSEQALKQDLSNALVKLPEHFEAEVCYKEHKMAERAAWFPGVSKKSDNIVTYSSSSFFEILRTTNWIL